MHNKKHQPHEPADMFVAPPSRHPAACAGVSMMRTPPHLTFRQIELRGKRSGTQTKTCVWSGDYSGMLRLRLFGEIGLR